MGTAKVQGALWGARAEDWATYTEQVSLPLFGAALDAARVTAGTRLLDAGCGSGLLAPAREFARCRSGCGGCRAGIALDREAAGAAGGCA